MSIDIYDEVFPSQEQLKAVAISMRHAMNSEIYSDTPGVEIPQRRFGPADYDLARRLVNAGKNNRSHCKFLRQMPVTFTVKGPMYWYSELDTYKQGTVRNSSSKMHKMMSKPFERSDFSFDNYPSDVESIANSILNEGVIIDNTIAALNEMREAYLAEPDPVRKNYIWRYVLQVLPESYNQTSTLSMNYEVLHKIWIDRHDHKLSEWRTFCKWIEDVVPMSDLIVPNGDM